MIPHKCVEFTFLKANRPFVRSGKKVIIGMEGESKK
jgi:hypothetical protein